MDIMDIQAVESKLSDVTVTPIPRSQVQNFYNYQQQREQREQQPQIQISAIHHSRNGSSNSTGNSNNNMGATDYATNSGGNGGSNNSSGSSKRDRNSAAQSNAAATAAAAAAAAVAALQYSPQFLQAQLALLQKQSNTTATPSASSAAAAAAAAAAALSLANIATASNGRNNSSSTNNSSNNANSSNNSLSMNNTNSGSVNNMANLGLNLTQSQLKYPPPSTSPVTIVTTQTSANITTPLTSTANLPTVGSNTGSNGLSKYAQLLAVIEEMGRDIRPTYTGSRSSTERLKRGIVHARILVRECLMETERAARQ